MDGQMDIFNFIDKPKKDTVMETVKPSFVKHENETDPDYLGIVSDEYALKIKGQQLNFSELEAMIGQRIIFRTRCWLRDKGGTQESNRYMIVKVMSYVHDREEIYDFINDQIIGLADGCLVQDQGFYRPLSFWLNELYVYGGKDAEILGYKKSEFIYKIDDSESEEQR